MVEDLCVEGFERLCEPRHKKYVENAAPKTQAKQGPNVRGAPSPNQDICRFCEIPILGASFLAEKTGRGKKRKVSVCGWCPVHRRDIEEHHSLSF